MIRVCYGIVLSRGVEPRVHLDRGLRPGASFLKSNNNKRPLAKV